MCEVALWPHVTRRSQHCSLELVDCSWTDCRASIRQIAFRLFRYRSILFSNARPTLHIHCPAFYNSHLFNAGGLIALLGGYKQNFQWITGVWVFDPCPLSQPYSSTIPVRTFRDASTRIRLWKMRHLISGNGFFCGRSRVLSHRGGEARNEVKPHWLCLLIFRLCYTHCDNIKVSYGNLLYEFGSDYTVRLFMFMHIFCIEQYEFFSKLTDLIGFKLIDAHIGRWHTAGWRWCEVLNSLKARRQFIWATLRRALGSALGCSQHLGAFR